MKTVLSIQDISCVGRCSLTVALPVLSAMGLQCSVLPTAVLSTHTGFPGGKTVRLTEHIGEFLSHWQALDVRFDAVLCGYLASPAQAEAVIPVLEHFRQLGSLIIVDPAMGDHGKLYRGLDEEHVAAMAEVCMCADILLPNITEAALLTELSYKEETDGAYLRALTGGVMKYYKTRAVLVTGVRSHPGTLGFCGADREEGGFVYQHASTGTRHHGTGDLFSAVFTGGVLRGENVYEAGVRAAEFVRLCAENTPCASPMGIEFEAQLSRLWQRAEDE